MVNSFFWNKKYIFVSLYLMSQMEQQHNIGLVTKSTGSWYTVLMDSGEFVKARMRGSFRLKGSRSTNPVVVGDRVTLERGERQDEAVITQIQERRNCIVRRSSNLSKESHVLAANIDMVYLVATLAEPSTSPEFIDRVLVTAQAYNIAATLVFNKIDLLEGSPQGQELLDEMIDIYKGAGYEVLKVSALNGTSVDQLRERLRGKVSLFTGNSGVGKSTLINAIDPGIGAKVGQISSYHHKGMHTTTFSEIFPISGGGFLIDTPGVKGFGLVGIEPQELCRYFPEMMRLAPQCQYYNCTHRHEPGCAVMEAVAVGEISQSRYESYLKMAEEDKDGKYRK